MPHSHETAERGPVTHFGSLVLLSVALLACREGSSQTPVTQRASLSSDVQRPDTFPTRVVDTLPREEVADLPRDSASAAYVAPTGREIRVGARGNLQAALNRARAGDVVLLAPGATYEGTFTLPERECADGAWITVRTDVADSVLPGPGERITPAFSPRLAKIATATPRPALRTANPTCGWRIMALEITATPALTRDVVNYGLLLFGDGSDTQRSAREIPARLILDRVYLHGLATTNSTRCLALNSARTAVVNSWISDCHAKGFDSQAIEGWNGPGPYLIENNTVSGAGENIMFGGADPAIRNLVPSDITIRRNHVFKDPAWKGVWTVKNLFELKNARRVLIEGNVFENNWADAQAGMAIVIKSSNDGGSAPWQGTTDVTFRDNLVRNSPRGLNVQGVDGGNAIHVARVRAENNLFEGIGEYNGTKSGGWLNLVTHGVRDVAIRHNTMIHNVTGFGIALVMDYGNGTARHVNIDDNIFTSPAGYAIFYSGTKVGIESLRALAGSSWTFARNVVADVEPSFTSWHPPQSWYPRTAAAIGFVDVATHDYRLSGRSQYKQRGKDGTDPGVDVGRLTAATRGVVVSADRAGR